MALTALTLSSSPRHVLWDGNSIGRNALRNGHAAYWLSPGPSSLVVGSCVSGACCMRYVRLSSWPTAVVLLALSISLNAHAQSTVGVPMTSATGQSFRDAVDQNQKELIDREVLGGSPGGRAAASGGGLGTISAFPTGRLRTSDHDGVSPPDFDRFGYTTREASAFGNVVATLPGTVLGGQVKVSGFAGNQWLSARAQIQLVGHSRPRSVR